MAEIVVAGYVSGIRNQVGQYIERGNRAARNSVLEQLRESKAVSRVRAPHRTGELHDSIDYRMTGAYEGVVEATADHAAPQEEGAAPHAIGAAGQLLTNRFDFSAIGHPFTAIGPVQHPGNPAVRYMRAGLSAAEAGLMPKLRRNWPQ